MPNFQKIINLLKKTGDRAIILDEAGEPAYVLMAVADYEKLVFGQVGVAGLTEEELLAKINREIAIWKEAQKSSELPIDQRNFAEDLGEFSDFGEELPLASESAWSEENGQFKPIKMDSAEEDRYYFEPVE